MYPKLSSADSALCIDEGDSRNRAGPSESGSILRLDGVSGSAAGVHESVSAAELSRYLH